jgi:hypothetical protein
MFVLRQQQGRTSALPELVDRLAVSGDRWMACTPAVLQLEAGRREAAQRAYESFGSDGWDRLPPRQRGLGAANLGVLAAAFGDRDAAARWTAALAPVAQQLTRGATIRHCGAHVLGLLGSLLGDVAADEWFATAVRVHDGAGAVLLGAESRLEWARHRLSVGDVDRARALADEAREAAIRRRASGVEGQARALLSSIDRGERRRTSLMDTIDPT